MVLSFLTPSKRLVSEGQKIYMETKDAIPFFMKSSADYFDIGNYVWETVTTAQASSVDIL